MNRAIHQMNAIQTAATQTYVSAWSHVKQAHIHAQRFAQRANDVLLNVHQLQTHVKYRWKVVANAAVTTNA